MAHTWPHNILGVDPMTAIRAATYWPSVAMKVDRDVGTVTPGKYADVIAVRGDVLRHIALLQRVGKAVQVSGRPERLLAVGFRNSES
jgi:imidazolonepropionase-like amidohydrolase